MKTFPEGITVRRMTADDVGWARESADASLQTPHWPEAVWAAAVDFEATPRRVALVAESTQCASPGRVLSRESHPGLRRYGFVVASLLPPQAELEMILVAPDFRCKGLGRLLYSALATELKKVHVIEVMLEVRASNHAALCFYRSLGFIESGRRKGYYADPVEDALLMRLPLD
jgi:ribosomal-protein-alanine N-acetyltransferase